MTGRPVLMWEARISAGRLDEALAWVLADVLPSAQAAGGESEAFAADAADGQPDRLVVVVRWPGPSDWQIPSAPDGVVARAHAWTFREALREGSFREGGFREGGFREGKGRRAQ